jgi:RimJ/RimL family protein N-acetyltransferase
LTERPGLVLRGERVTLRPIRPDEVELVWRGRGRIPDRGRLAERLAQSGVLHEGWLELGIEAEGALVGDIGGRQPREALPPGVYEIGIDLFASRDRGRGYGREAVALLTTHLFDAGLAERVQGSTDVGNAPMRRVFELLGFREEGLMRGFMPARGGRADYVLYAVLRDEWRSLPA